MAIIVKTCFLFTVGLLTAAIYSLMMHSMKIKSELKQLTAEVDEIMKDLNSRQTALGETRQLSELVDAELKKRLAGVWDDIYTLRKQLKGQECDALRGIAGQNKNNNTSSVQPKVNFASEDLGARIERVKAEPMAGANFIKRFIGMEYEANPPVEMIRQRPQMLAGSCFAFKHNISDVIIRLSHEIIIEEVEMGHISAVSSPTEETKSAPKDFKVFGISRSTEKPLGHFVFDNTRSVQRYPIEDGESYGFVRIRFESNHGHPIYTCVYRVAVYGRLPSKSTNQDATPKSECIS